MRTQPCHLLGSSLKRRTLPILKPPRSNARLYLSTSARCTVSDHVNELHKSTDAFYRRVEAVYGKRICWLTVQKSNRKFVEDARKPFVEGSGRLKLEDPLKAMDDDNVPVWFKHVCDKSLPNDQRFCFIGHRSGRARVPATIKLNKPAQKNSNREPSTAPEGSVSDSGAGDADSETEGGSAGTSRKKPLFLDDDAETAAAESAGTPPPPPKPRTPPPANNDGDAPPTPTGVPAGPKDWRWRSTMPKSLSVSAETACCNEP